MSLQSTTETSNIPPSDGFESCPLSLEMTPRKRRLDLASIISIFIVVIGGILCGAFITLGVRHAQEDKEHRFEKHASELVRAVKTTWDNYHLAALWVHETCRSTADHSLLSGIRICSREDFRELYEYMSAGELEFKSVSFIVNVSGDMRDEMEQEARAYYEKVSPGYNYVGFTGLEDTPQGARFLPRIERPYYTPHHLVEPIRGNEFLIDLDVSSLKDLPAEQLLREAVATKQTTLSYPFAEQGPAFVMLLHPGIPLTTSYSRGFVGVASVTFEFETIAKAASVGLVRPVSLYIYDTTSGERFFGGAQLHIDENGGVKPTLLDDVGLDSLQSSSKKRLSYSEDILVDPKTWTVVVVADSGTYKEDISYEILGGVLIFLSSICLAFWFKARMEREKKIAMIMNAAQAERASLIVENAQKAARSERELNDFIAHEVRNPLTSAMSACSFLSAAHKTESTCCNCGRCDDHQSIRDDIEVVNSSLQYINDLLRSMLDMHRAANRQMVLDLTHTDVLKDVFEPVRTILHRQADSFDFVLDCPANLVIMADRMRLKQVVLNLASNSRKFVHNGFVRLRAEVVEDSVRISVEDSGPGIPPGKRSRLFCRFQESLDSLNQGTGMGLSLCKYMVELMGGEIWLDDSFDSGVTGSLGACFIVDTKTSPVEVEEVIDLEKGKGESASVLPSPTVEEDTDDAAVCDLPEALSVLVVDDDMVVRKLLRRSLLRVAPGWSVQEASNGETAISMVDGGKAEDYDLIFMDQYMASVEKQLLGTETIRALRSMGVSSQICGLSANNMEKEFLDAGATTFLMKPFPCDKDALRKELSHVLHS